MNLKKKLCIKFDNVPCHFVLEVAVGLDGGAVVVTCLLNPAIQYIDRLKTTIMKIRELSLAKCATFSYFFKTCICISLTVEQVKGRIQVKCSIDKYNH